MRSGYRTAMLAAALLLPRSGAAAAVFPGHSARIDITIAEAARATVVETFLPGADLDAPPFELLDQPCAIVGSIVIRSAGHTLPYVISHHRPWTFLTGDERELRSRERIRAGEAIEIEYGVGLDASDATIPLVVPSAPLRSLPDSRGADVTLRATFGAGVDGASVVLPRFERAKPGTWGAHMLAVPSAVRVHLPGGRPSGCGRVFAGSTGGLEWRFWIFVATMATWIPIYFWWFGREDV